MRMEFIISCLRWLPGYRFLVDSYHFTRYSIAQVASFYDPGCPTVLYPFGRRTILFTTGDACEHILCDPKHRNNYRQRFGQERGLKELGMFHRGLIWNNDLTSWKESRGCFQYGLVDATFQDVAKEASGNVDHVMQNTPVDANTAAIHMMNALRWVTLNFTMKNLLGLGYIKDWGDAIEMIDAIVTYFKAWEFFLVRPWWWLVRSKEFQNHRNASKNLHDICERIVCQFEDKYGSNPDKSLSTCLGHAYKKYKETKMSRKELIQLTLEILLAGTDTSSVTMFYCLGYLVEHPRWYTKVQREVDLASAPSSLPILTACIKESMRLKPVGPIIMRRFHGSEKDIVDGQTIHPGDQVILHLAAMNRHNVDAQDTFDPSRFLHDDETPKKKLNFAFYPFGKGPKGCVGEFLAMIEMLATMFHLLRTKQIFFAANKNNGQKEYSMETMETNWDIAQQPQREEEMQMIVKPLTRQVFFVGPSSTGKTTMIKAMSERYPDAKVHTEIARQLLKQHGITDCKKELLHNAKRNAWFQKQLVDTYAALHNHNSIKSVEDHHTLELFDRCAIDAIVYSGRRQQHNNGSDENCQVVDDDDNDEGVLIESSKEWKDCLEVYRSSHHPHNNNRTLVILFNVVEAFRKNDNVRLLPPSLQDHVAEELAFETKMKQLGISFQKLSETDPDRRQEQLVEFIEEFIAE